MMILARSGQTYARLTFNVGPKVDKEIAVRVDWSTLPESLLGKQLLDDHVAKWRQEYEANVQVRTLSHDTGPSDARPRAGMHWWEGFGTGADPEDFDPLAIEEDHLHECPDCPHAG